MQTNDSQTPQTSQNLAETQPADAKGFRPVEARQVPEIECSRRLLAEAEAELLRDIKSLEEAYVGGGEGCIEFWEAMVEASREYLAEERRYSARLASGGAKAHIEPSLNEALNGGGRTPQ